MTKRPFFERSSIVNRPLLPEELSTIESRAKASSLFNDRLRKLLQFFIEAENQSLTNRQRHKKGIWSVGSDIDQINGILKKLKLDYGIRSIKMSRPRDGIEGITALRAVTREGRFSKVPFVERGET